MIEFQKKKKIRKILYSPFILIILVIVLLFLIKGSWTVHKKALLSKQNLEKERLELQKLIENEKNLASSIEYLKTDQGIESEIRSKFRAVKDGEKIAVIIDDEVSTTSSTTTVEQQNLWYRIFHWFVI